MPESENKKHQMHDELEVEREHQKEELKSHSQKGFDKRVHFEEEIKHEHKH